MASAMVKGLLAGNAAVPADLSCMGGSGGTAAALAAQTGIKKADSLERLLEGADALVVAFKPYHLASADPRLAELTAGRLVASVLAGKRLDRLSKVFPKARNLIRCMPNTPSQIGAGITGWCSLSALSSGDQGVLATLLGSLGRSIEVPESQMDALTAVSGSGPAYLFEFAAALRDAGIAAGLAPETSETLAIETLLGASRLLARRKTSPEKLRDEVTSPNGVTFAGLRRLAAADFRGLVRETVLAAKARSEELSRDAPASPPPPA